MPAVPESPVFSQSNPERSLSIAERFRHRQFAGLETLVDPDTGRPLVTANGQTVVYQPINRFAMADELASWIRGNKSSIINALQQHHPALHGNSVFFDELIRLSDSRSGQQLDHLIENFTPDEWRLIANEMLDILTGKIKYKGFSETYYYQASALYVLDVLLWGDSTYAVRGIRDADSELEWENDGKLGTWLYSAFPLYSAEVSGSGLDKDVAYRVPLNSFGNIRSLRLVAADVIDRLNPAIIPDAELRRKVTYRINFFRQYHTAQALRTVTQQDLFLSGINATQRLYGSRRSGDLLTKYLPHLMIASDPADQAVHILYERLQASGSGIIAEDLMHDLISIFNDPNGRTIERNGVQFSDKDYMEARIVLAAYLPELQKQKDLTKNKFRYGAIDEQEFRRVTSIFDQEIKDIQAALANDQKLTQLQKNSANSPARRNGGIKDLGIPLWLALTSLGIGSAWLSLSLIAITIVMGIVLYQPAWFTNLRLPTLNIHLPSARGPSSRRQLRQSYFLAKAA